MSRIFIAALALLALFAIPANAQKAERTEHKLVLHLPDGGVKKMNQVLNNAASISKYYAAKGQEVQVEIVTNGPGLQMLAAASPVKQRVMSFIKGMPNVTFAACGNTMAMIKRRTGKDVVLLDKNIKVVPAGVGRVIELQEQGWSYVRP